MVFEYKTAKVNYEIVGEGETNLVFLHGWGGQIDSFKFACKYITCDYKALFIDFPPFGKSTEMKMPWTIFDYAEMVLLILRQENMTSPIIVGHSFGGRVACLLACGGYAQKLFLIDSAGLKPKKSLMFKIKQYINKKKIKKGKIVKGSKDYNELSPVMKKTFVNIVNTFLEKYVINIKTPTVIFWGKNDKETKLYMAKRFNKLIKNSQLVIIENGGHFSYLDDLNTFVHVLNAFISDKC